MKKINLFKPFMGAAEAAAVKKTLLSGWITLGPRTEEFEQKFAKYVGAKHAVAVNSATAALHLALIVLGVKKGDEVITTPLTFATSAEVVLYVGATPVFADVQEDTLNIDPKSIEKKITKRTKAIQVVHYGGQPCDMDEINRIAKKHKIPVIEDAAHAAGAVYKGKRVGGSGNITCFSFHAVKNLATGDGGMITMNDPKMDAQLRKLRWFGISKSTHERESTGDYRWDYDIEGGGFKYHMNDINASIGLVQLAKLEAMNKRRAEIAKIYDSYFKKSNAAGTPVLQKAGRKTAGHIYCLKLKDTDRRLLMNYLAAQGISTGVHYKPLYYHARYKRYGGKKDTPIVDRVWPTMLSLPMHPALTNADAHRVAKTILSFKR